MKNIVKWHAVTNPAPLVPEPQYNANLSMQGLKRFSWKTY